MAATDFIVWRNLGKQFQREGQIVQALQHVTTQIGKGEFVAVVGPSGCGKSTLLNLTAGLMRPSEGEVLYDGAPVRAINTRVGYMTQKDNLLPWRTVSGNVGVALDIQRVTGDKRRERVAKYTELVGLQGFEHHYPAELSGGMRKRALLARTLIYEPETLLMDEPFGALDAQLRLVMHDELQRIWEQTHKTVIFITHDLVEAVTLADRILVMTSRPGTIKHVQPIPLPRPRDVFTVRFTPEFGELHNELWRILEADFRHGESM